MLRAFSICRGPSWRIGFVSTLMVMTAGVLAPAHAQWTERNHGLYPNEANVSGTVIFGLQRALFVLKCYGNKLEKREVDGEIGPHTKKAIDVFIDEYGRRNPKEKPFPSPDDMMFKLLEIEIKSASEEVKYCERSKFRSLYFTEREHVSWTPRHAKLYPRSESAIARMKVELFKQGCYGEIPDDAEYREDFGSFSRRALHVFVEEYQQRYRSRPRFTTTAQVQNALEDEAAKAYGFCAKSKFLLEYFPSAVDPRRPTTPGNSPANPNVCEFPRTASDWMRSQEEAGKARYKGPRTLEQLSLALERLEAAIPTYLETIPSQAPPNSDQLELTDRYNRTYTAILQSMRALARDRSLLARLGAISQNDICRKCVLLDNFEWLNRFSEQGRLLLVTPSGQPVLDPQNNRVGIEVSKLYFDALLKSHRRIQDWRGKEEAFLAALKGGNMSNDSFQEQRKTRIAADEAKFEAIRDLIKNNDVVPPSLRQRHDLAIEFAAQRSTNCIGDFSLDASR